MKHVPLFVLVVALIASMAGAAWQRSSPTSHWAAELAMGSVEGVKIESSKNIGRASALISGRLADQATLPSGNSEAVINLGRQAILERVSLHNEGGEGRVAISTSTDFSSWVVVGQTVFSPVDSQIAIPFAPIQGRYVKVEFELARAGSLRNFKVFGKLVAGSKDKLRGKVDNMASAVSGARVIYVNPSPSAGGDDAVRYGSFYFPESADRYRTVIYDLGRPKVLTEFGSVHSPRPVRFEVFVFSQLPEKEDWKGRRSFDPAVLDQTEPVASVEDRDGKGFVKCKPEASVTAQFVALRWEPDFNPPAFVVGGLDFVGPSQDIDIGSGGGLEVDASGTGSDGKSNRANASALRAVSESFTPSSLMGAGAGGLPAVPKKTPPKAPSPTAAAPVPPVLVPPVSPAP